jgi:hypothetical protein
MAAIGRAEARLQHQFNSAFDRLRRLKGTQSKLT